jgi:uncharacterized protein
MNANTAPARTERVYADTLASDPPRVHLLIVQSTPFCNLKCKYCYLNDLTHKATASEETLDNLFRKLFRSGWVKRKVDLCWHAGEPTATGIDFYRKAHEIIERYRPRDVVVRPSLQTNGTLINQAWCEFFRESGMHVGLSIDGPRRITDLNRLNHAGRSAFDKIVAGLRLLKREDIPFAVIAVLSAESLRSAREIYDFFADEGVERVAFNVEESEGEHVSGLKPGPDTWRAYRDFFAEFAALSAADGRVKSVREWENGFRSVFQNRTISPGALETIPDRNILVSPFGVTAVDHLGNIATFSPELLGNKNGDYNDYIIGNVNQDDFADLPYSPTLQKMYADIQEGVAMCRQQCVYYDVCGGGQPINKISENGTFASSATSFCRMTRMAITDLIMGGPHGD